MEILDPRVEFEEDAASASYELGRAIGGVAVGLRLDRAWRSYFAVVDEWERRLAADGARPHVLWTGERVGREGERTRSDLDEWSRLVDCAVVGLGN
jgi:hypothetical protein